MAAKQNSCKDQSGNELQKLWCVLNNLEACDTNVHSL